MVIILNMVVYYFGSKHSSISVKSELLWCNGSIPYGNREVWFESDCNTTKTPNEDNKSLWCNLFEEGGGCSPFALPKSLFLIGNIFLTLN